MDQKYTTTDEQLMNYIDGLSDAAEVELIEKALSTDQNTKERYKDLVTANDWLVGQDMIKPSAGFSKNIMQQIASEAALQLESSVFKKNGLLILLVSICTVVIGSVFMVDAALELTAPKLESMNLFDKISIPQLSLSQTIDFRLLSQASLFLLTILSLMIFDKAILKPYFLRRRAT